MSSDQYRVGIIGCGTMGGAHASAYESVPETSVVAAADQHPGARKQFADEYDVPDTYETYEALLAGTDIDVLSVCTWHSSHAEMTVAGCEADIDGVYVEKPMATSWGEAEDMVDAADRNDVTLTVGHQNRFAPIHEELRDVIAAGDIGDVHLVRGTHGGGLLNWGTHLIDTTRFMLGDPDTVWVMGGVERKTDRYERGIPIEDRSLAQIALENGVRMTLESDLPDPSLTDEMLQLYGTTGMIDIDFARSATIHTTDDTVEIEPDSEHSSRIKYVEEFVDVMSGEQETHRCSGEQAAVSMEIMMGIYESARRREVIEFPLETRANALELLIESGELEPSTPGRYDIRLPYQSVRDDRAR